MPSTTPSTSTRIAKLPYLNSVPFFRGLALEEGHELTECVPRQLGMQARAGSVDAGLLSVVDYLQLQDRFERLGHFGIAVRGQAHSVFLFSRKPIRQLEGATITVTEETSTTACLLRLILEQRYEVLPAAYQRGHHTDADALLLIGDEALRFRQANRWYPFEIDVAFEWWLWQHVPFVFAVWAIRRDLEVREKKVLEVSLARTLADNLAHLDALGATYAATYEMPAEAVRTYLANFIYRLGHAEEDGIRRFQELLNAHHLL